MNKKSMAIALVIIAIFIFLIGGYRFTPLNAAKANSFVTKDYELIGEYKNDESLFYLFKSDEKQEYRTVLVNKNLITYQSNSSTFIPYNNDSIKTIGGMSFIDDYEEATLLVVNVQDEKIEFIQIETENGTERKQISENGIVHFLLPYSKQIDQLNATAYDKEDNELYYYGYKDENPNSQSLKWYKK